MKRNIICRFLSFVCTMALLGTSALAAQNPKGYLYDQETGELNPYYSTPEEVMPQEKNTAEDLELTINPVAPIGFNRYCISYPLQERQGPGRGELRVVLIFPDRYLFHVQHPGKLCFPGCWIFCALLGIVPSAISKIVDKCNQLCYIVFTTVIKKVRKGGRDNGAI